MLPANSNQPNRRANRDGADRIKPSVGVPSESLDPANDPSSSKPMSNNKFANLAQFSDWLDAQLKVLEVRYESFETTSSRCGHFGR